jgi:hypothetical protein
VDFTVKTKGPTLESLVRDTTRELRAANRTAGRDIGKVGKAAMGKGAPRMFGRQLAVKTTVDAWPSRCAVEFNPAKRQSGPWAIAEAGRRGGYLVRPRRRDALAFSGRFARFALPGNVAGRRAWTAAVGRLVRAVDRTVHDVYDDALGA